METELWPNLLRECGRRAIPVMLVNGRISPTSFRRYQKIRVFMRNVLGNLTWALMQSKEDAKRISALGLSGDRITTVGNLKFDSAGSSAADGRVAADLRNRFEFNATATLIVAASTHSPEESVIIDAFKNIKQSEAGNAMRLLLAPRHPERFDEVAKLIASSGLSWSRRSEAPSVADATSDIVLLDSIGELRATFQLGDIAFMGGSIIPHGGQNMLEPAAHGVCVITGVHTHNFAAITRELLMEDSLIQLPPVSIADAPTALGSTFIELLRDEARRKAIGMRAQAVCMRNRGATERTSEMIAKLLDSQTPASAATPFPAVVTAAK